MKRSKHSKHLKGLKGYLKGVFALLDYPEEITLITRGPYGPGGLCRSWLVYASPEEAQGLSDEALWRASDGLWTGEHSFSARQVVSLYHYLQRRCYPALQLY